MKNALRIAAQLLLYVPLMALIGYFSTQPRFAVLAEDQALVTSLDGVITVPYATFDHVLVTEETTPLEPGLLDDKLFAPGVGLVFSQSTDGEVLQLVQIRFDGTSGDDTYAGRVGPDDIHGLAGDDELSGNAGDDTLSGGRGTDSLTGGPGNDVFNFDAITDSPGGDATDIVADFLGGADHIDLAGIDANANQPGDQAFQFIGDAEFTAAGQLRAVEVDGGTLLHVNANNNLGADLSILVQGVGSEDFALSWARNLNRNLRSAGVAKVDFHEYPGIEHIAITQVALGDVFRWLDEIAKRK